MDGSIWRRHFSPRGSARFPVVLPTVICHDSFLYGWSVIVVRGFFKFNDCLLALFIQISIYLSAYTALFYKIYFQSLETNFGVICYSLQQLRNEQFDCFCIFLMTNSGL